MNVTPMTLDEVARSTGGRVLGDGSFRIRDAAPLRDAGPDELGLLSDRRYVDEAAGSRAGAFLLSESLVEKAPSDRPRVVVADAHAALIPLLEALHPTEPEDEGVHPTAVLGRAVSLGAGVSVGPYAVIGENVVLGDGVRIGPQVTVGSRSRVGEGSVVHPQVVLYPETVLGRRVIVHAGARIGVDGFGYARIDGRYRKVPQVGRVIVEDDVEIGANACVDRGSIGDTVIGSGSKLDNLVHLAHNVRVGEDCAFAAQVGIAGSTRVGKGVVFGGQAGLAGHLTIGEGARISAQAGVIGDVAAEESVTGYPARDLRTFMKAAAHMLRLPGFAKRLRALEEEVGTLREPPLDDEQDAREE